MSKIVEQLRTIADGTHLNEQKQEKTKEKIGKLSQLMKGVLGLLGDGDKEEAKKVLTQARSQMDEIINEL